METLIFEPGTPKYKAGVLTARSLRSDQGTKQGQDHRMKAFKCSAIKYCWHLTLNSSLVCRKNYKSESPVPRPTCR